MQILLCVLQALLYTAIVCCAAVLGLVAGCVIGPFYVAITASRYFSWLMPFGNKSDGSLDRI